MTRFIDVALWGKASRKPTDLNANPLLQETTLQYPPKLRIPKAWTRRAVGTGERVACSTRGISVGNIRMAASQRNRSKSGLREASACGRAERVPHERLTWLAESPPSRLCQWYLISHVTAGPFVTQWSSLRTPTTPPLRLRQKGFVCFGHGRLFFTSLLHPHGDHIAQPPGLSVFFRSFLMVHVGVGFRCSS